MERRAKAGEQPWSLAWANDRPCDGMTPGTSCLPDTPGLDFHTLHDRVEDMSLSQNSNHCEDGMPFSSGVGRSCAFARLQVWSRNVASGRALGSFMLAAWLMG